MASGKSGRAVRVGMGIEAIGQAASAAASPPQAAGGGDVPPILEIRHARKRFKTPDGREVVALDDVSISVAANERSEEHTSELQSLMRISYAVFCLKKKKYRATNTLT